MKTTKTRLAVAGLFMLLLVAPCLHGQQIEQKEQNQQNVGSKAQAPVYSDNLRALMVQSVRQFETVYRQLPDGTFYQRDFNSAFGKATADSLINADVRSISKYAGHVRISFGPNGNQGDIENVHVTARQVVECDVTTSPNGMEISSIDGLEADVPSPSAHVSVRKFVLIRDLGSGNVTVTATAGAFRFLSLDYSVTVGPDGKPLPVSN